MVRLCYNKATPESISFQAKMKKMVRGNFGKALPPRGLAAFLEARDQRHRQTGPHHPVLGRIDVVRDAVKAEDAALAFVDSVAGVGRVRGLSHPTD